MAKKQQLDKAAWQWAESTDPESVTSEHIRTAYRLLLKPCKPGVCRRNCKGNPLCLVGLGEKEWQCEITESHWHTVDDPNSERRKPTDFVGLKNLGATCYVNTLLQLWFHNPVLRSVVLRLQEPSTVSIDEITMAALPVEEREKLLQPTTVSGHLQLIFTLLLYSKRRNVDPTPFINCLGLDAAQQQDAQEFSKLFMSLLEDTLCHQVDTNARNIVQQQFKGEYHYVTKCSVCSGGSKRPSNFYELDLNIKGHKQLSECIEEFLQEEKLVGDNQYQCSVCQQKRDAVRRIQLHSLPPTLNIQLLRFVFDRASGTKKKLNTYLQFPEVLDLSRYMQQPEGSCMYDLYAVLIHRGPSAYSGHYIAHIKDQTLASWYKFNDEEIQKVGGKGLQLGKEEEVTADVSKNGEKKPKMAKGCHASRNAYMLVYCQRNTTPQEVPPTPELNELPWRLQQSLALDTQQFEGWVADMEKLRTDNVQKGQERHQEVLEIYSSMPANLTEDDFNWVTSKWINKWLIAEDRAKVPEMDFTSLMCRHNKVDPEKVIPAKCISSKAFDILLNHYPLKTRLAGVESLCERCVVERCRSIRARTRINEDSKLIGLLLKDQTMADGLCEGFWVGKSSLRSWKRLALERLEEEQRIRDSSTPGGDEGNSEPHTNKTHSSEAEERRTDSPANGDQIDVPSESTQSDVPPAQDGLIPSESTQPDVPPAQDGLIPSESTQSDVPPAQDTLVPSESTQSDVLPAQDILVHVPSEDKQEDSPRFNEDLLCDSHGELSLEDNCRRVIPSEIWHRLRLYFPDAPEFSYTASPCAKCVEEQEWELAQNAHNKAVAMEMRSQLADLYAGRNRPSWREDTSHLYILTSDFLDSWRQFLRDPQKQPPVTCVCNASALCPHGGFLYSPELVGVDGGVTGLQYVREQEWTSLQKHLTPDIQISVTRSTLEDGSIQFKVNPGVCEECCAARQEAETQSLLTYTSATIYVRKVVLGDVLGGLDDSGQTSLMAEDDGLEEADVELQQKGKKRKKGGEAFPGEKLARLDPGPMRRSARHRRIRGEKDLTVSAKHTLRDLKLQVMHLFSVAPFDQHLHLDGRELTGDQQTLASLRVLPNCILYLKVDEPMEDPTFLEDSKEGVQEEGFKGTGLLGR